MNRHMNRAALASLQDADVNLFVVEALRWTDEDQRVLDELVKQGRPIILVLNKVDKVSPRERLLPFIEELNRRAQLRRSRAAVGAQAQQHRAAARD